MKKLLKREEFIKTYTGKKFHVFNPKEEELDIIDIAHSLSLQCRFNGHTPYFYSVASHSIIGSKLIAKPFKKEFLCHDMQEAFCGDFCTPMKRWDKQYIKMEKNMEQIISKKYKTPFPMSKEVKEMDNLMFRMEFDYLMGNETNEKFPMTKKEFMNEINKPYQQVEKEFLTIFRKLK